MTEEILEDTCPHLPLLLPPCSAGFDHSLGTKDKVSFYLVVIIWKLIPEF